MDRKFLKYNYWCSVSVFLISMTIICLQLMLMRAFSVSYYYHFSYLVISTGLLGFGASGTFLSFFYSRMEKRFSRWIIFFFVLFLVSIPFTYLLVQQIPIDIQYLMYSSKQAGLLILYHFLIFIPFFLGATIIGFILSYYKKEIPTLYGANLIGSGLGGIAALGFMYLFPAHLLPLKLTALAFLALLSWLLAAKERIGYLKNSLLIVLPICLAIVIFCFWFQPSPTVDPYKSLAHYQRLEQQNDADHITTKYGPRGQVDIYQSPTSHNTLFVGLLADKKVPEQLSLLMDGHLAGTIFSIESKKEAEIIDNTPQSIPYRLTYRPKVLLLGESGGINSWLAQRYNASEITVAQTNPHIIELMKDELRSQNGGIYLKENVEVIRKNPRLFLEQTEQNFDIIHLVSGEEMTTAGNGLQGLHEDYLLTTEAIQTAFKKLRPNGYISFTRGIQSPPRDNIKIFSLFANALKASGISHPEKHLLISRNYLAVNSLISKSEVTPANIESFKKETGKLNMDIEFFPGIKSDQINQINSIDGPKEKPYSYLHFAYLQILSENPDSFYRNWSYFVRAPTDNSPYFHNFFKWDSLDRFIESYGKHWFQRLELGYVILVLTFLELMLVAFFLILLPVIISQGGVKKSGKKLPVFLYFSAIGVGFMFLEMVFIQYFTKFMGDPIYSVAAVLTSILVFSGAGSHFQKKLAAGSKKRIIAASSIICLTALLYLFLLEPLLSGFIELPAPVRFLITMVLIFPISFFMGWMFPAGMKILEQQSEQLIPWAWGINGFASVTAAPVAIMLTISLGFNGTILLAFVCYLITIPIISLWNVN